MNDFAKDPSYIYRQAFFDKLSNQISVIAGKNIPVYDTVPADAVAPFIILSIANLTPLNDNLSFGYQADFLIDIVTRFKSGGGKKLADDIANKIFEKVYTKENFYSDYNWNITSTQLVSTKYLESESTGGYVIRKLVTFSNFIEQLKGEPQND